EEIAKLRAKAGSAIPSLPTAQGVQFEHSPVLTSKLQSELEEQLAKYQSHLATIGYIPQKARQIKVHIDEDERANAFFDDDTVSLGHDLASDPEYLLSE